MRRTNDAFGYSPLDEINTENVDDLRVAWSWSLPPGSPEVAPLVHDGVMFVHGQGDIVQVLDAATGEEMWRCWTIARPGEPGGESWNGLLLEERNGGSIWVPGTYDAELGLAYFGVAQTYDTGPLLESLRGPGVTSDALYTNTTVALDPDTGELVWHFQHLPNDQWDLKGPTPAYPPALTGL